MEKGYLYIAIATILFSSMEIAIKLTNGTFNPIQITFLRFALGGLFLLPLAVKKLKKEAKKLTAKDIRFFCWSGFFCVVISMILFQLAIGYTKASTVAIIFSCNPVFVLTFAALFLKEKLAGLTIIFIIVSLIGIVVIINPFEVVDPIGILLAVLAAITFAIYSVFSRFGTKKYHYNGILITCFSFIFGSAELLVIMLFTHIPVIANSFMTNGLPAFANVPVFSGIGWASLPLLFYLGIGVTGIGFSSYFLAMENVGVSLASLVFFIKPALTPIFAWIILGESINFHTAIGIIIILIGSFLTFIASREIPKITLLNEETPKPR
ncbi:EamA family transporter [Listeria ivanovii]|uniref:EamA family transporter n=1 Tax=Listeria ivanovii TaxID=1638 RepID=UPI00194161AD|nr:EamA family transporter [Listeria ivanovii]MBM5636021.1 EamA family transporter [Listeria ivanovii]MBM5705479.1 EamA family transporter [Listeria ivanovii]